MRKKSNKNKANRFMETMTKVVTWVVVFLCAAAKMMDWVFYVISSPPILGIDPAQYEVFSNNTEAFCEKGIIVICLYMLRGYLDTVTEKAMKSKSVSEAMAELEAETMEMMAENGGNEE